MVPRRGLEPLVLSLQKSKTLFFKEKTLASLEEVCLSALQNAIQILAQLTSTTQRIYGLAGWLHQALPI